MPRQIHFLPFSQWKPDGGEFGKELEDAENVLPLAGSFRGVRKASVVSSVTDTPVTGAHVHVYQQARQLQFARPDGDVTVTGWANEEGEGTDLYESIGEEEVDDSTYVVSPAAPSASQSTFSLEDISNPGVSTGHILRWRYKVPATTGAWTVKAALLELTTLIEEDSATGTSATDDWVQRDFAMTPASVATITDYADLRVRLEATVPGSTQEQLPDADVSIGGWRKVVSGTPSSTDLYQAIDESVADDTDYIESPAQTYPSSTATYRCGVSEAVDPIADAVVPVTVRAKATQPGMYLTVKVYDGKGTLIHTEDFDDPATTFTDLNFNLSVAEVALIEDWNLEVEVVASYPTRTTATSFQYARPVADVYASEWTATPVGDLYSTVDESVVDYADYIDALGSFSTNRRVRFRLGNVTDPLNHEDHTIRIDHILDASFTDGILKLYDYTGTLIATRSVNFDTETVSEFTLSDSELSLLRAYQTMELELLTGEGGASTYRTYKIELEVPEPWRIQVSQVKISAPSDSRAEFSYAVLETPDTQTQYVGDDATLIAGTQTKLYEVDSLGWTDISKGGGYAASTFSPGGWSLATWGNDIIATNFIDPVQVRSDNTGNFADLIATGDPTDGIPKARFAAPVHGHLMLADINLANHYADEVWWSALEDPTDFDPTQVRTGCDYDRLVESPGQIMGIVGGEFALVFKRRSIYRLDWVGGQLTFRSNLLTTSIGCTMPRSIVEAHGSTFFWGGECFYVTEGFQRPRPIGDEEVSTYLTDNALNSNAIAAYRPSDILEEDAMMTGAYDPHSGLIFWLYYRNSDSDPLAKARGVTYNPSDGRWSTLDLAGENISVITQLPNTTNSSTWITRGLYLFGESGGDVRWLRLSGQDSYAIRFQTKRFRVTTGEASHSRVYRACLLMSTSSAASYSDVTIEVSASHDPLGVLPASPDSPKTITGDKVDATGWFPVDLTGQYFDFTVTIPSTSDWYLEAFHGLYLEYDVRGED